LALNFFTDGDYPNATLQMRKVGSSSWTKVTSMTEPGIENYPWTLDAKGTYYFQLHRELQVTSPVIAKSCNFEVEEKPFPNVPTTPLATWTDEANFAYSVNWDIDDQCLNGWNNCGHAWVSYYELKEINPLGQDQVFNTAKVRSKGFSYPNGPFGEYLYQARACFSNACSDWSAVLAWTVAPQETVTYYHVDALGSVVAATNEQGNVLYQEHYDPYGARIIGQTSQQNTLWYTGKEYDADTGLIYLGARWYDPRVGRILGIDPANVSAEAIGSFNRYAYADNNPYRYIDPDGEIAFVPLIIWGIGAAITAYDTHSTYQEQGAEAAAKGLAIEAVMSVIPGGKIVSKTVDVASNLRRSAKLAEEAVAVTNKVDITKPYKRPSGATNKKMRESVQGKPCVKCGDLTDRQVAGHKKALVEEYYETGTIDKKRMRSLDAIQPECPTCSAKEGADMARFSRQKKKDLGL
jgi:RHS repeat-associated protein